MIKCLFSFFISEDDTASVSSNTNDAPEPTQSKKSTEPQKSAQSKMLNSKTDPKNAMRTSSSAKGLFKEVQLMIL